MRRINFRIWDGEKVCDLRFARLRGYKVDPYGQVWIGNTCVEDAVALQCTGLEDAEGREIYEGDIIDAPGEARAEVVFSQGGFCGREINGWDPATAVFPLAGNVERARVIGNRFENPDLLEDHPC